ncbi:MerR family transcriptional regulator [Anaerosporobacter sp.]|uniref:MerR family transcriptional regulator n=1 Tax=Anaerosporobacter sp. TaxID=1872529 RepID=UPI00286EFE72|nr:MerR family transcriptional regulator [Anaerosporobacter sp.]
MLIKIGDVTNRFGISHRSLHYWENAGILKSTRSENDYRYYDDENIQKIKQIVLLRKLRLSIPSIQEIFTSDELSKIIAVFTNHLDETKRETEQLNALGTVLRQLLNMLKDKQNIDSVYKYLDTTHSTESEELKIALKTVLSEPAKEITLETPPESIVDMTGINLSLHPLSKQDIPELTEIIKSCYTSKEGVEKLYYWDFDGFDMPSCRWFYKVMQDGRNVGAVNLVCVGMEAMLIRSIAYDDPDNNVYLFELLKQTYPDILCWNIYFSNKDADDGEFHFDWEGKKKQFADDNGFTFYTNSRWDRYIKTLKPHDEIYNSSRYRFALLDGSMDGVSFRFFGADRLDWYDGKMTNWTVNDCDFGNTLIYDSWLGNSKFYDSSMDNSDFRYTSLLGSSFINGSFQDCKIENCDISGMTIDSINVKEALEYYKSQNGGRKK